MFCGDEGADFFAQFVQRFVGADAFAAQPGVEAVKGFFAAVIRPQGFGLPRAGALHEELRPAGGLVRRRVQERMQFREQLLAWVEKQRALAQQVFSCHEAGASRL